jgi:hypothetical protein
MPAYMLTWNPRRWEWSDLDAKIKLSRKQGFLDLRWSLGINFRQIKEGSRVFLLRQALEPKGIMASGQVTSEPFEDEHFADPKKVAWYVEVRFEFLLSPKKEILPLGSLDRGQLRDVHWGMQSSGTAMPQVSADELERVWFEHLRSIGLERRVKK